MGLPEQLIPFTKYGLDTSIFIYHFEAHPIYRLITQEIFDSILKGQKQAVTSTITLMEINVRPLQLGRKDIAREYEALLFNYPNMVILDIDRDVARKAAQLRAELTLRPADALQVAACMSGGAQVFITNDKRLNRLESIKVAILDDLI